MKQFDAFHVDSLNSSKSSKSSKSSSPSSSRPTPTSSRPTRGKGSGPPGASKRKGTSKRRITRDLEKVGKDSEKILLMFQFGNEESFFKDLFTHLGPDYMKKFEFLCIGTTLRMLSGRKGNGQMQKGGPSKYPQGMSCLTFAICNGELFLHTADSDCDHQSRCWSALLLAYALRNREVVQEYLDER